MHWIQPPICCLAAGFLARDSQCAAQLCGLRADACHPMDHCQRCAQACRDCAASCRQMGQKS